MLRAIDETVRGVVSWILALIGLVFCWMSEGCIRSAAWVAQVSWDEIE
jgi:hypothetical protein